jgi:hypothetical protein
MATQHNARTMKSHEILRIQPYDRVTPSHDPAVDCRVVIPGAAVICTRVANRGANSFPSLQVRGRKTPDYFS